LTYDPDNFPAHFLITSDQISMAVGFQASSSVVYNSIKAVKVQLSLKGLEFSLIKVGWKYISHETINVVDVKRKAIRSPADDISPSFFLTGILQHFVELSWKWAGSWILRLLQTWYQ